MKRVSPAPRSEMRGPESQGGTRAMTLSHYSTEYVTAVNSVEQDGPEQVLISPFTKPKGLWLSVDGPDDWMEWCRAKSFELGRMTKRTRVTLSPSAVVCVLSSALELDHFTERYGQRSPYGNMPAIRWDAVAQEFQGVIIAPYIWQRRMSLEWYYTWDCASGCIWSSAAIEFLEPDLEWSESRADFPPVEAGDVEGLTQKRKDTRE